jgi:branched-chain amino acid transport system ATP-binding protein
MNSVTSATRDLERVLMPDVAAHIRAPTPAARGQTWAFNSLQALSVQDVRVRFGGVDALAGANFAVATGAICGLIGPNGAGKTTLFNCISGLTAIDGGRIAIAGRRIDRLPAHARAALGVSRTFQNLGLYLEMSALENVMLGGHAEIGSGLWATALHFPGIARREQFARERALAVLEDIGIAAFADRMAGTLPYGTMKRVELARALMATPKLLLLDEPAGGLAHGEVEEFAELIRALQRRHLLTIVLIEHHMKFVMGLCDQVVVLHLGTTLAQGRPDEVRRDPRVIAAYLGAGQ